MSNIFLVTLAIIVGLLWSGAIDAEMKWTATMFGLSLAALLAGQSQMTAVQQRQWRQPKDGRAPRPEAEEAHKDA